MNRFELHTMEWQNCTRCKYSERRKKVVLGKGELPCDILFVAEAPGDSEDVIGKPMVAQAGRLMDQMLVKAGIVKGDKQGLIWTPDAVWRYTVSFTNLVACIPLDENREKEKEPDYDCVLSCKPRLEEWIEFASPKLIVVIGKPAREWFEMGNRDSVEHGRIPIVEIVHPASILRQPFVQRSMSVQSEVIRIRLAIRNYLQTSEERDNASANQEKPKAKFRNLKGEEADRADERIRRRVAGKGKSGS